MIPSHKCFTLLLLGVLLLAAGHQQTAWGAPGFMVQDQRFNYPLPGNNTNTFSFLVFSTEGDITGTDVVRREVKTADGESFPLEAVQVSLENGLVTPQGRKVSLTLDPKFFLVPGEYRVVLFFQGGTGTPSLSTTIVINRLAADINLDEMKDQTLALTRPFPLWPASSNFTFFLRESTGRVNLSDVKIVGQGVYLKDTKELSPGSVAAAPIAAVPAGSPVNVPPGSVTPLQVSLWGLTKSGTFDTRLLVTSASFSGEKVIPIKVTVRDFVLFPMLAVAIGVVGGFFTRRLVAVERPRNENMFQLLGLQNEVERFREVVSKQASIDTVNGLLAQLKTAREKNEIGDFNAVKAELPKIQEKLDEFRKAQLQAGETASTTRNGLVNQVELLEDDATLTDDERRELQSLKRSLAEIERLLRVEMVDEAQEDLEDVRKRLEDFRVRKLTTYFETLKTKLEELTLSGADATTAETLKAQILGFLKSKDFDKTGEQLEALKSFIEKKQSESQPENAGSSAFAGELPAAPRTLPQTLAVTRIAITTPIEERIAGETINFTIEDPQGTIEPNARFRWFFGDVGFKETDTAHHTHRYNEARRFHVRVEILKDGIPNRTLSEFITIAPGTIEQARANLLQDILRNEKLLSIIALVLAIITGLLFLYVGKVFGSLVDYLTAILWGFGIDNSIKGFAAVLAKISGPDT